MTSCRERMPVTLPPAWAKARDKIAGVQVNGRVHESDAGLRRDAARNLASEMITPVPDKLRFLIGQGRKHGLERAAGDLPA